MTIKEGYAELCEVETDRNVDIRLLLPILKEYADKCNHVTEMGVRHCISTYAFLASDAEYVVGYDIMTQPEVRTTMVRCSDENRHWEFYEADVLKIEIEETGMLFIDTFHTATQLSAELKLHHNKVKRYIALHDTSTFWDSGELAYGGVSDNMNCGRGLKYAIEPFLAEHPEWKICFRTEISNGLLIMERQ